ncbi:MAG: hypothetical protein M0D53_01450 [Flavobacterium sp. JAD_PAG50586_2]|nr:MAG: hypothetical protein M0D53_01450 [Flavobacterium sp. JAD_PAG50586_2]
MSQVSSAQIASWNYEPLQGADPNPTPNIGSGSSSVVNGGGGTIGVLQRTGMAGSGCGTQNGSIGWAFEPFDPGSINEANGARFNTSTSGYQDIKVTWDQRFSNTSPNTVRLQYTTNGSTWNNFIMTSANTTLCAGSINANGCFENNAGDVYRRVAVDLTSITGVNNNPNFGVRMMASYYQSTTEFRQSNAPGSVAGTAGTWRFDNVTISGTIITVPNPSVISNSGPAAICAGGTANIKVTITGGISPYTLIYTNGSTNFTVNNYVSGTNIAVSPASTATYTIVSVTAANGAVGIGNTGTATVTVNSLPTILFTAQPGAGACVNTDVTYTTQSGQTNYVWTISGVLNTDYTITSGGGTSSNTLTIKWLTTAGTKTVSVNYTNSNGCPAASATTSTATTIYALPTTPTFTTQPGANVCAGNNVTYTTQTGRFNYAWTFPGVAGVDYSIVSGGTSSNNTVTLIWLTGGSKIVTVNYSNQASPNCNATANASNTTNVNIAPVITSQNSVLAQNTCIGTPFTALSVTATGTNLTYQWWTNTTYSAASPPTGGAPTGVTTATFSPPYTTAGTRYYYVIVGSSGCTSVRSTNYTLAHTVNPLSVGGNISGSTTVCAASNSTVLTLTGNVGGVTKWQSSSVSDFSSGITDIANTTNTLTATNLLTTTYYRAIITSGACAAANSAVATITVTPASNGGILAGSGTICSSTINSTLTLSGELGSIIKWQSSPVSDFSSGVADIANTTNSLNVTNVLATTYYRAVVQNSSCPIAYSSVAQLLLKSTTWNGSAWSNGVPDNDTRAIFASLFMSAGNGTGDLQACSLEVLSNAVVTVKSGDTFTIQNEVKIAASMLPTALIFEDSASLIQINNVVNTDPIYYRRSSMPVKKYDYTYWSSPVANQVISSFSPNTSLTYVWDTSIYNWSYTSNTSTMDAAKGYILRTPDVAPYNTVTANVFNGEFFGIPNNGTITAPISFTAFTPTDKDMNLIGNPYPSAIDADAFLMANRPANGGVLNGTIFYWTHNTPITANNYAWNDYASYNLTGGVGTAAPSSVGCPTCNSNIPNGKVGAGQSFFIQSLANGVATFTNAMRFGVNNQFYKNNNSVNTIEKNRLWLDISNENGLFKQLLIGYIEGATNDFDTSFDGLSVDAGNPIMMYTILEDKKLAIQGRTLPFDENDVVPVGYKSTVTGNFEIKLSNFDGLFAHQDVYLEDALTNTYTNLKNGNYSFATEVGTFDNRFKIHFVNSLLSNPEVDSSSFIIYQSNNQIHVNSGSVSLKDIEIYDIQGRRLNVYEKIASSTFSFNRPQSNIILLLKITSSEGQVFYKKIISQ